jgi:hypothetical protein
VIERENVFLKEVTKLYSDAKPHYDEDKLKETYGDKFLVAFVDILGFSSMIENDPRGERFIPMIENAIKAAFHYANIIRDFGNPANLNYRVFSDNICFWIPLSYHTLSLAVMLSVLSEFQLGLLSSGVLCRGGLAVGYHYTSEYILYGPALVEAVRLEHAAIHPCISVSNSIVEDIHLVGIPLQMHQYHKLTHDGPWFVNYLSKIFFVEKESSLRIIEHHHNTIAKKMRDFSENPKILSKYIWVADYHNDLINMIKFKDECAVIRSHGT